MKGFAIHLVPMAIQVIEAHTSLNFSNCDVVMKVKTYCLIYWVKSLTTYYYCCCYCCCYCVIFRKRNLVKCQTKDFTIITAQVENYQEGLDKVIGYR